MFEESWDLLECLTPKRVQLMRSITLNSPKSIRELAFIMDRDVKNVWNDLQKLSQLDLISFKKKGRSKKPFIKKQVVITTIEVEKTIHE